MKIDCEGCEWKLFSNSNQQLKYINYIAMEYHIPNNQNLTTLVNILENSNFICKASNPYKWGNWLLGILYAKNLN